MMIVFFFGAEKLSHCLDMAEKHSEKLPPKMVDELLGQPVCALL
jgi:hypothetical protein